MTESRLRRSIRILRSDNPDRCECGQALDLHAPLYRYGPMTSGVGERRTMDPDYTTSGRPRQKPRAAVPGVDYVSTPAQRAFGEGPITPRYIQRRKTDLAKV